jgi:YD repeat-containing protein
MRIRILILAIAAALSVSSFAQYKYNGPSMPSANAASLGQYGEMPVSYFTGVPSISIPLYEVKGNNVSLPIALSYHASGLRPDVHPSWVGNGWNLEAGGAITRKVNGFSDEFVTTYQPWGYMGYYYNYSNLNQARWTGNISFPGYRPVTPFGNNQSTDADSEPDDFSFNFLGISGKFFLDQTGQWQVQSDRALKVVFNSTDFVKPFTANFSNGGYSPTGISQTFGIFTIIDEFGNKYVFGSKDANNSAIEFSDFMVPSTNDGFGNTLIATSWFLTKIISADGTESIILDYERGPLQSQIGVSCSKGGYSITPPSSSSLPLFAVNWATFCSNNFDNYGYSGNIIFPVYLKSISLPNNGTYVDFTSKSKSNELTYTNTSPNGSINSNDAYYQVWFGTPTSPLWNQSPSSLIFPSKYLKDVSLSNVVPYYNLNPYPANDFNQFEDRFVWLKLDAIKILNSNNGNLLKQVNFNYNNDPTTRLHLNSFDIPGTQFYAFNYNSTKLPPYLSTWTDHWGFNNNSSIPYVQSLSLNNNDVFSKRQPDQTGLQTQAEILNSITYPTGGTTSFIFEPNTYGSVVYRDPINYSTKGAAPTIENGIGGGLRIKQIITSDGGASTPIVKNYYYVAGFSPTANPATLSSSGILDTKPVYQFNNSQTTPYGSTVYYSITSSNSVIPLTSNSAANIIGYSSVVEQKTDGSYTLYEFTNHNNPGYQDQLPINVLATGATVTSYPVSSLAFERGKLLHKADFGIINKSAKVIKEEYTTYGIVGPSLSANAVYNHYFVLSGSCYALYPDCRAFYRMYYHPFMPTSKTTKLYSSDGSSNLITTTTSYTYDQFKNLVQQQTTNSKAQTEVTTYSYPYNFITSDPLNPYYQMVNMNNVAEPIEKRTSIDGNITNGQLKTFSILSSNQVYNTGVYNFEIPISTLASSAVTSTTYNGGGNLSFDSHYTLDANISYNAYGNITSINKPNGVNTNFIWGYNNQYLVGKVVGSNYNTIMTQLNQSVLNNPPSDAVLQGQFKLLRPTNSNTSPLLPNTLITSYTYIPLVGLSSQTDPTGLTTSYNYDNFGRLYNILDNNNNYVKTYSYKYVTQPFPTPLPIYFNDYQFGTFNSNICSSSQQTQPTNYSVPAGKYTSTISVADANNKAISDLNTNGQNAANAIPCISTIPITICCNGSGNSWKLTLTNTTTGMTYYNYIPITPWYNIGSLFLVPPGNYNVNVQWTYMGTGTISGPTGGGHLFSAFGFSTVGTSMTLNNINIVSPQSFAIPF